MKLRVFLIYFVCILFFLSLIWLRGGFSSILLDTDLGRDLSEMSNIHLHKVVWLGPRLSAGFPSSPIYYYLFYPALVISRWNAQSLIVFNVLLALAGLGTFAFLARKKLDFFAFIPIIIIGLMPFWKTSAIHPGNGYTYMLWFMFYLVFLWFELPLFIPSLFLGLAISHHPAATFGLVFLLYEWWRRGHSVKQMGLIICGLLLPWTPIILFEIITKGYLTRSYLKNPTVGVTHAFQLGLANIKHLVSLTGINIGLASSIFLLAGFAAQKRLKVWYFLCLIPLVFFLITPSFPQHYLLSSVLSVVFVISLILSKKIWGKILLALIAVFFIIQAIFFIKTPAPTRSITKIDQIVSKLSQTNIIDKKQHIAVLAILSQDTSVPQADDYRFFLRKYGYSVLEVVEYSQADTLLLFVEQPGFKWQTWSTWETDQFGSRKVASQITIDGVKILKFIK